MMLSLKKCHQALNRRLVRLEERAVGNSQPEEYRPERDYGRLCMCLNQLAHICRRKRIYFLTSSCFQIHMSIGSQVLCLCSNSVDNRIDKYLVRWYLNPISKSSVDKFGTTNLLPLIEKNAFGQQGGD